LIYLSIWWAFNLVNKIFFVEIKIHHRFSKVDFCIHAGAYFILCLIAFGTKLIVFKTPFGKCFGKGFRK
jgi:hypothetical protein